MRSFAGSYALAALAAVAFVACAAHGEETTIKVLVANPPSPQWNRDGPDVSVWLNVKPSDTVGHLKDLVKEKTTVPQRIQMFVFDGHSLNDDSKQLSDYHVHDKDTLWLNYGKGSFVSGRLYVDSKRPGYDIVMFKPEDSVSDLEKAVAKKLGIQADQLLLLWDNQVLSDRRGKLSDQGVDDDRTIQVSLRAGKDGKFPVYARYSGYNNYEPQVNTYVVVDPSDTVATLKEKIIAASPELKIKGKKFRLQHLDDETKTLAEYNVKVGDSINVHFW